MTSSHVLPAPLRWAVRLLLLEAIMAVVGAVFVGYYWRTHEATALADAFALVGFVLLIAAALAGLAFALARRKPRARAPAIVIQLLAVMATVLMTGAGLGWLAVPVAALGIAVATLLLAPSTTAVLIGDRET